MTGTIIITLCILLLLAYLFDLTSSKTRIPSVILLLALGWGIKQLATYFNFPVPDFSSVLPVLGTVGLILIVLEGSLELELNKTKFKLMGKSFLGALFPIIALAFIAGSLFYYLGNYSFKDSLINAIPFCVISSSIAIPSVRNLSKVNNEFIVYESSFSDIFGVLAFNFIAFNTTINLTSFTHFAFQIIIILLISVGATLLLSFLLNRIEHHIKFIPIILLIVLVYESSKIYHLPSLIFILILGLFLGNLDQLKKFKIIQKFKPNELELQVKKFKELTVEATFIVRALFFLLFGFLITTAEIFNSSTILLAIVIVVSIILLRIVQLKLSRLPFIPLLFVAPRGLITILLFLSIPAGQQISLVNKSLLIQVIILMALFMMVGLMIKEPVELGSENTQEREDTEDKKQEKFLD